MVKKLTVWYYNVIKLSTDKLKCAEVSGTVPKAQRKKSKCAFPFNIRNILVDIYDGRPARKERI